MSFQPPRGRGGPQFIPRPELASLGEPAPWDGRSLPDRLADIEDLIASFEPHAPDAVVPGARPPSAVLVPIQAGNDGPELVLTRRSWRMRSHTGEIAFPGGRMDDTDPDLAHTALRETHEEIGVGADFVRMVGELDRLTTVASPSFIVPFVGVVEGSPTMVPEPAEVDAILTVSLAELADPSIYREELWPRDGALMPIHFFELDGDTLWGATARVVRNLLMVLTDVADGR